MRYINIDLMRNLNRSDQNQSDQSVDPIGDDMMWRAVVMMVIVVTMICYRSNTRMWNTLQDNTFIASKLEKKTGLENYETKKELNLYT